MADPRGLYGTAPASRTKHRPINSSTALAFSSNLASLISQSKSSSSTQSNNKGNALPTISSSSSSKTTATVHGRPRPTKPSIFTAHNKNSKKRAAADLLDDDDTTGQTHQTKDTLGAVDAATLHRSKRRMEDKVRLYNAMKRGEYIGGGNGSDRTAGLVDFDRKWAEREHERAVSKDSGTRGGSDARSSDSSDDDDDDSSENDDDDDSSPSTAAHSTSASVTYLDEFGRQRHGTAKQAARSARRTRLSALASADLADARARPTAPPSELIHGDTIQAAAFNPDAVVAERMAALAAARDREPTPPEGVHYDAGAEVRNRGTGFYAFSRDEGERAREMAALEEERRQTARRRGETEAKGEGLGAEKRREGEGDEALAAPASGAAAAGRDKRRHELEERKRKLAEARAKREADRFLDGLQLDVAVDPDAAGAEKGDGQVEHASQA